MSVPYAGADVFQVDVPLPVDQEDEDAASTYATPMEALADRTTYLKNRLGQQVLVTHGQTEAELVNQVLVSSSTTYSDSSKYELISLAVNAGDSVEVDAFVHVASDVSSPGAAIELRLAVSYDAGALAPLSGTTTVFDALSNSMRPVTILGAVPSTSAGTLHVWMQVRSPGGTAQGFIYTPYTVRVRQYRPV